MHESVRTCLVVSLLIICVNSQGVGKSCFSTNGTLGTCERISKCKSAQQELRRCLRPVMCGFDGNLPVVCCTDNNNIDIASRSTNRISEEKCNEYRRLDIKTTIKTTTTMTTEKSDCGGLAAVGGRNAYFEEFPHMALLGYGSEGKIEFQCGGSLISEQFVLTAGHCLESRISGPVSLIRLGELDISSDCDLAEPQNFNVSQTYPHPDYDFRSFYNDIALIKLDRPVIYTRYVKPACLQSEFNLEHNNLTATGWGAIDYGQGFYSYLQTVQLKSLPIRNCLPTYKPQFRLAKGIDEELQICGGNLEERMDTCQGDSGGPLQLKIQDSPLIHRVVGVTSFGSYCGLVPGIYTRISKYLPWIESIVWPS